MQKERFTLKRNEIIRGFGSYKDILKDSKKITSHYLTCAVRFKISDEIKISPSNQKSESDNVILKAGFSVSSKLIRKSSVRNRVKRLIKESYRLNRIFFLDISNA